MSRILKMQGRSTFKKQVYECCNNNFYFNQGVKRARCQKPSSLYCVIFLWREIGEVSLGSSALVPYFPFYILVSTQLTPGAHWQGQSSYDYYDYVYYDYDDDEVDKKRGSWHIFKNRAIKR